MQITKEIIAKEAETFIVSIFQLPEVVSVRAKDIMADKSDNIREIVLQMVDKSYHDCYSDVDLHITIRMNSKELLTPSEYMKQADRFGIHEENCLGFDFVSENRMYRIVMKNGVRYDLKFDFVYDDTAEKIHMIPVREKENNPDWPAESVNQFWFVQVQALGKLYRNDYLIGDHLANRNLNETLVQQMVLRDLKYGTNHHRYGHKEELTYMKYKNECPAKTDDIVFQRISEKIYCAALAYDELTSVFYSDYEKRSKNFFEIWECYEQNAKKINKNEKNACII